MSARITNDRIRRFVTVERARSSVNAREVANKHIAESSDPDWLFWDYHISGGTITVVYVKYEEVSDDSAFHHS